MKIRLDYVTNSSSSSFIIGKKDDKSVTVESVYQTVRSLYLELKGKIDTIIDYFSEHPWYGIEFKDGCFRYIGNGDREDFLEICSKVELIFGLDICYLYTGNLDWLRCETYADYEKFWQEKFKESSDTGIRAPFTIGDLSNHDVISWPHYYYPKELAREAQDLTSQSEIYDWYSNEGYDVPNEEDLSEEDKKEACLLYLGKVCIYSECGLIPAYVVERLGDISNYYCDHMG